MIAGTFLRLFEGWHHNPTVPDDLHVNLWPMQVYLQDPAMNHVVKSATQGPVGHSGPVGSWGMDNMRFRDYPNVDDAKPLAFVPALAAGQRGIAVSGMVASGTPRNSVALKEIDPAFLKWMDTYSDTGNGPGVMALHDVKFNMKRLVSWLVGQWSAEQNISAYGQPFTGFIVNT